MEVDATPDMFEDATEDIYNYARQNTQMFNALVPPQSLPASTNYFVLPYSSPEFATFFQEAQTVASILNIEPYSAVVPAPAPEPMITQESMFIPISLPSFNRDTFTHCGEASQTQLSQDSQTSQQHLSQKTKISPLSQTDKDGLNNFSGDLVQELPDEKFLHFEEAIKPLPEMCREIYEGIVREHTRKEDDPAWRANQDILIDILKNFNKE